MKMIFKIIISLGLLFLLWLKIDWQGLNAILASARFTYIFLSFIALLFAWFLNSRKWQLLLKILGLNRPLVYLFKLNLISFFYSLVLPGGQLTGEVLKCFHLAKNEKEKPLLILSVLFDRLTGFLAYAILGFLAVIFSVLSPRLKISFLCLFGAIIASVVIACFVFLHPRLHHWLQKILMTSTLGRKINSYLLAIKEKSVLNYSVFRVAMVAFLSLLFQLVVSFYVYFAAKALGVEIAITEIIWIFSLVSVILVLPITYAGLGLRESSFVYLLSLFNIAGAVAFSLSLLVLFVGVLVAAFGGFWLLIRGVGSPQIKN
ncbi:MAG TPA: lysylphosphatidylglycerol synthase transmembrane domain-containing protein [Patescibacteria group bacterium]|nr:lysylphosphatidylglycerol synthase transmembrane domain-containing protein [Patescibacteria group bacterium]